MAVAKLTKLKVFDIIQSSINLKEKKQMPNFTDYEVEYTNMKPWNNTNLGSGKMTISMPNGSTSIKAKLKRAIERKINSLGVRIDSFSEITK